MDLVFGWSRLLQLPEKTYGYSRRETSGSGYVQLPPTECLPKNSPGYVQLPPTECLPKNSPGTAQRIPRLYDIHPEVPYTSDFPTPTTPKNPHTAPQDHEP